MNFKRYIFLAAVLTGCMLTKSAIGQTPGYIQSDVVKTAGITTDSAIYSLPLNQRQTTRVYYDGLGRTLQTILVQASPGQNDIIQPVAYDNVGRQAISYLPYAGKTGDTTGFYRGNAISVNQPAFYYQTTQHLIDTDKAPYSQRVFENSPLQRVLEAGMDGAGFQPGGTGAQHYKTIIYRPNTETNLLAWKPDGSDTLGSGYPANTLRVKDYTDEDTAETRTFTDRAGHLILKRQKVATGNYDTYYIYNNAGMISFIVPPLAVNKLAANNYNLASAQLKSIIFKFVYDARGRLIEKTVPGRGTVYIVYDPVNRPVLIQDTNMKAKNQWNYMRYDSKGRAVSQGIYTDANSGRLGRVNMQNYVNSLTSAYNSNWFETRTTTLTNGGYYTSVVFPTASTGTLTALAYAYFDDYNMTDGANPTFTYVQQKDVSLPNEESPTTANVKGMPTVVSETTVGAGLTNTWLTRAMFYDKNLHVIQVRSNNQLNYTNDSTLTDATTIVNDFAGMPLNRKESVKKSSTDTISVYSAFIYDQAYRIDTVKQKYNGGLLSPVAVYSYNEIGQLVKKSLGNVSGGWLQNVDMRYNIRGQLLYINNSKLTSDGGVTSSDANDVFGMQLLYDQADSKLGNTPYHNGKVSAVKWMSRDGSGNKSWERAYKYSYDKVNRYTGAAYSERGTADTTGTFGNNIGGFDEYGITYDAGGNFLTLKRNSSTQGTNTHHQVDSLVYSYNSNNANQLTKVTDGPDSLHWDLGFKNPTQSTASYGYDPAGNLVSDPYKGITKITYNVFNRTDSIKLSATQYITYTYNAEGALIRKQAYKSGTTTQITDYIGGCVYNNTSGTEKLSYFPMPEGRVLYNGTAYTQEFVITDPQGNARVSFQNNAGSAKVYQENSYYGTGLIMANSPVATPATPNKKLYNGGSEWQNDYSNLPDYYQTFNRNYDAAIGRFIGVDPAAESVESMSGYQYAGDNPVMNNDPMGDRFDPNPPRVIAGLNEFGQGGDDSVYGNEFDYTAMVSGLTDDSDDSGSGALTDPVDLTDGNDYESTAVGPELADADGLATIIHLYNGRSLNVQDGSNAEFYEDALGQLTPVNYFDSDMLAGKSDQTLRDFYAGNYDGLSGIVSNVADVSSTRTKNATQGGDDIAVGLTAASLDAMSETHSSVGIFTQKLAFGYYPNGWKGSQFVNTFPLGKVFDGASTVLSVYTTGKSYYDILNGQGTVLNYSDAGVGTIGLGAKVASYYYGVEIPFVGEGVAIYGTARTAWDIGSIMAEGNREYTESAKAEGCNVCLLDH